MILSAFWLVRFLKGSWRQTQGHFSASGHMCWGHPRVCSLSRVCCFWISLCYIQPEVGHVCLCAKRVLNTRKLPQIKKEKRCCYATLRLDHLDLMFISCSCCFGCTSKLTKIDSTAGITSSMFSESSFTFFCFIVYITNHSVSKGKIFSLFHVIKKNLYWFIYKCRVNGTLLDCI